SNIYQLQLTILYIVLHRTTFTSTSAMARNTRSSPSKTSRAKSMRVATDEVRISRDLSKTSVLVSQSTAIATTTRNDKPPTNQRAPLQSCRLGQSSEVTVRMR